MSDAFENFVGSGMKIEFLNFAIDSKSLWGNLEIVFPEDLEELIDIVIFFYATHTKPIISQRTDVNIDRTAYS